MEGRHNFSDANKDLSLHAIDYACDLALLDVKNIAGRLYLYGRIPLSRSWFRQFPSSQTLLETILRTNKTAGELLAAEWLEKPAAVHNDRWTIFLNKAWKHKTFASAPYKLYINLHPDSFITNFDTVIRLFTTYDVPVFKFSKDVYNLVRPDKFVAYITDFSTLITLGNALSAALKTAKVQALPFTAAFADSGIVSCGFDPPAEITSSIRATSWRSFITEIIARSFSEGRSLNMGKTELMQNVQFWLKTFGVNTEKWLPGIINQSLN